jgi:integral membrane sensor domain MASE1
MLAVARPVRPWLAAGILVATVAVNLLGGNGPAVSSAFALVNAGEGWLVAELLQRRFGFPFRLDRLDRALGLLLAAAAAAALAGASGAVALRLVGPGAASAWDVALLFLAADFVGVATVAPLVLALATVREHAPAPRRATVEGTALLASLAALFPLLLLLAVRCPPMFAMAAPAVVALATVWPNG